MAPQGRKSGDGANARAAWPPPAWQCFPSSPQTDASVRVLPAVSVEPGADVDVSNVCEGDRGLLHAAQFLDVRILETTISLVHARRPGKTDGTIPLNTNIPYTSPRSSKSRLC